MTEIETILVSVESHYQKGSHDIQRIFHGRGHCYRGFEFLTIDYFSTILFLIVYKNVSDDWIQLLTHGLVGLLSDIDQISIKSVYLQRRWHGSEFNTECIYGDKEAKSHVHENGLMFQIDLSANQNIGFFPDMSEGRKWLTKQVQGKHILNLFAYTCSLSVVASASGARSVTNIDMAKNALKIGRTNHRLNNLDMHQVNFLAHNIFKSWSKLKKMAPFDLIIIDPPGFQPGSFEIKKDYPKLIRRLPQLVSAGANVMACLNYPHLGADFVKDLFKQFLPDYRFLYQLKQPDQMPECTLKGGLKILIYQAP